MRPTNNPHLYIQSNSPGELTAWVRPVVNTFKQHHPTGRVTLLLTPCQYATGEELVCAGQLDGVDDVLAPKETIRLLLSFHLRQPQPSGVVLCLGGDPMYTKLFAKKFKLKSAIYTHHSCQLSGFDWQFMRADIGDLMAESIQLDAHDTTPLAPFNLTPGEYTLFLCGSRPQHFFNLVPIMQQTVRHMCQLDPNFMPVLLVSPFIRDDAFDALTQRVDLSDFVIVRGQPSLPFIKHAKFVVTIPGTNTAQAGYLGTPGAMLLPLNHPEALILDGLPGLIGKLPLIGRPFLWGLIRMMVAINKKKGHFYALPNQQLKRDVFAEIVGVLDPQVLAEQLVGLCHDKVELQQRRKALDAFSSPQVPSQQIISTTIDSST